MKRSIASFFTLLLCASVVAQEQGPFCGAADTPGSNAISRDSSAIVAWATGVSVVRGPQKIDDPESPLASYGPDESIVLGKASNLTTAAVSLGDGGSATLTFDRPIRNGIGPDFAVFENGMKNMQTGGYFLELGFVEVSSDGEHFVRFPATSLTPDTAQQGPFADTDPTMLNNLAGKYTVGFGTPFDLDELRDSAGIDLQAITHVRIVDVVGCIDSAYATYDAFGHRVNDPWPTDFNSSGFDLTGVAVLHQQGESIHAAEQTRVIVRVYPNPVTDHINVIGAEPGSIVYVSNLMGQVMMQQIATSESLTIALTTLKSGIYLLHTDTTVCRIVKL